MALKALLVGINEYVDMPLKGCVNDVVETSKFLKEQCGLTDDRFRLLTDAQATKQAIEDGLRWLMEPDGSDSKPVRLFQYSGHGTFIADEDGDEKDGRDEALVPYDYQTNGLLIDDTLCKTYAGFTPDTHLLLTMDCCHSGTIQRSLTMDRRYRFLLPSFEQEKLIDEARRKFTAEKEEYVSQMLIEATQRSMSQAELSAAIKAAMAEFDQKRFGMEDVPGNIVLLSACRADQTAADARFGDPYHGAMTYFLLEALRQTGGRITYNMVIDQIGKNLYQNNFPQLPQLECSAESRDCNYINLAVD